MSELLEAKKRLLLFSLTVRARNNGASKLIEEIQYTQTQSSAHSSPATDM